MYRITVFYGDKHPEKLVGFDSEEKAREYLRQSDRQIGLPLKYAYKIEHVGD